MVNKIILLGRVGSIESKEKSTIVSVATTEQWTKDGEKQEKTEWHRVTFFSKLAEIVDKYLEKGQQVYIEGKLQYSKVEGKKGEEDKYYTNIIGLEMKMLAKAKSKDDSDDSEKEEKEEKNSKSSKSSKNNSKGKSGKK